jgi:hypothetical protein
MVLSRQEYREYIELERQYNRLQYKYSFFCNGDMLHSVYTQLFDKWTPIARRMRDLRDKAGLD